MINHQFTKWTGAVLIIFLLIPDATTTNNLCNFENTPCIMAINETTVITSFISRSKIECTQQCCKNQLCLSCAYRKKYCWLLGVAVDDQVKCGPVSSQDINMTYWLKMINQPPKAVAEQVKVYRDCVDVYKAGIATSGVYKIQPNNFVTPVDAFCDTTKNGGGWLVIQRRFNGKISFVQNWNAYKIGFGNVSEDFWFGNEKIAQITSITPYIIRFDMDNFNGITKYAEYSTFAVAAGTDKYRVSVGTYSGTAGDSGLGMSMNNGMQFSTVDQDNDVDSRNCSKLYGNGGWWFNSCSLINPNGIYYNSNVSSTKAVTWFKFDGSHSLKFFEMKIRPISFP